MATKTSTATQTTVIELQISDIPMSILPSPPAASAPPTPPPTNGRVFDVAHENVLIRSPRFLIVTLVIIANLVQFISNFLSYGAGFSFSKILGQNASPGESNWMAASYSLTQGTVVLISGRLGAIYGHKQTLVAGGAILVVFTLVNGFCKTYSPFVAARALTGVGGGLIMPNAVAIITTMLPPGRLRNITMGLFAASAPIGGWLGALFSGLFIEKSNWQYLFFTLAAFGAVIFIGLLYLLPHENPVDKGGKIDYLGAFLGLTSLLLFNFVWNQAPAVGWYTSYEIACLIISVLLFCSFLIWEHRYATAPIMPLGLFQAPTFSALFFVVLLSYMSFGISLWYMIAWQQLIRGWTVLDLALGMIPFALGATAAVLFAAWLIPRLAAQYILAIGVAAVFAANLLLGTMPMYQSYWPQVFPAILLSSVCPDFMYVAAQLIASNSVGRKHQGVAGSLIGTLNLYGNSLGLGFAGTMETEVAKYPSSDALSGYRAALYFGAALAVVALAMDFAWVRMPKDEREGWNEELDRDEGPVVVSASGVESGNQV